MCQTIVRMPLLFFWKGKMTAVIQDNKKNWQEKVLKWNRASCNIRLLSKKITDNKGGGRKVLWEKSENSHLHSNYVALILVFFLVWIDSKYTYFTPCIHFLIASREIRDRTSGQGWASNRDSGNYPHHRYISDSPEQERVLIQVITIYLQDGFQ